MSSSHPPRPSFVWDILGTLVYALCDFDSSEDPHNDLQAILAKYSSTPESEPRLKLLLPRIISTFGANKSVKEIMEELEQHHQSADATGSINNMLF